MNVSKSVQYRKCGVTYCGNRNSKQRILHYFKIPKDPERRAVWIRNCVPELADTNAVIKDLRMCEAHFEDRMFLNINQKNRLTDNAVPTLFSDDILAKRSGRDETDNQLDFLLKCSKDILFVEEPFEVYDNNSNNGESIELEFSNLKESRKKNCEWNQYETEMLMDMYKHNVTQVGLMKKFRTKREMFKYIALTISAKLNTNKTVFQCENKYKTVINQQKVGRSILQKKNCNVGTRLKEEERSRSDVTASVSADHDYNGQITKIEDECVMKPMNEWGVDDTKLLLELYSENIDKVGLEKTFRTKFKMFEYIAEAISNMLNITRTPEQCLNRHKTVFRRKHWKLHRLNDYVSPSTLFIEDNINSNKNTNCNSQFINDETEFNNHIDDNEMFINQSKTIPKQLPEKPDVNQDTLLVKTLREIATQKEKTLLKIASNKERAEERRHRETMDALRQLNETIVQCFGNRQNVSSEHDY